MTRRHPETDIRIGIRTFLRDLGWAVWDMEQNRPTRQTPGFSDLVACGRGRILFIEVKTAKGKMTPAQAVFAAEIGHNGGTYLVWRSVKEAWDWLEAEGIIKEVRR
jgi:Holliday junction resolvase-like predicted endonuclease